MTSTFECSKNGDYPGLISIVLAGAPATAGSVILSSPVSSSRTGLNTGTLGDTSPTPVLTKLTLCLPSSSVVINPRTGKSTEVMPGWMVALPAAARLAWRANRLASRPGTWALPAPASVG